MVCEPCLLIFGLGLALALALAELIPSECLAISTLVVSAYWL